MKYLCLSLLLLSSVFVSDVRAETVVKSTTTVKASSQKACDLDKILGKKPSEINWVEQFGTIPDDTIEAGNLVKVEYPNGEIGLTLNEEGRVSMASCNFQSQDLKLVPSVKEDVQDTKAAVPEPTQSCEYSSLVGMKESDVNRAQFGEKTIVRVLTPGQMVTMEYLEGRINLNVDDNGVIVSVTCG